LEILLSLCFLFLYWLFLFFAHWLSRFFEYIFIRIYGLDGALHIFLLRNECGGFRAYGTRSDEQAVRAGKPHILFFRNLPVSERSIFFNFFIKDIIFYIILWILPIIAGFSIASDLLNFGGLNISFLLLASATLSFLIGLSGHFFFRQYMCTPGENLSH